MEDLQVPVPLKYTIIGGAFWIVGMTIKVQWRRAGIVCTFVSITNNTHLHTGYLMTSFITSQLLKFTMNNAQPNGQLLEPVSAVQYIQ